MRRAAAAAAISSQNVRPDAGAPSNMGATVIKYIFLFSNLLLLLNSTRIRTSDIITTG